jgi:hypothetical protein
MTHHRIPFFYFWEDIYFEDIDFKSAFFWKKCLCFLGVVEAISFDEGDEGISFEGISFDFFFCQSDISLVSSINFSCLGLWSALGFEWFIHACLLLSLSFQLLSLYAL